MAIDLSVCSIASTGNIRTPKGRLSHAQYMMEGQENDSGNVMYNGGLLLPPTSDFKILKQTMYKIAFEKLNNKDAAVQQVNKRFLDPMNKPGGGKPEAEEFEGFILLRCSSKYRPDFIGPDGKAIPFDQVKNNNLVYSGRWARFTVNPYWFEAKANKGITVGLQNVQLLDHDENIGGGKPSGAGEFEDTGVSAGDNASGGYNESDGGGSDFEDDVTTADEDLFG